MIRTVILFFIFFLTVGPIAFLFAVMEASPAVQVRAPSNAADAVRTRAIFREFRALTDAGYKQPRIRISQSDMNSILAFAARALPFLRGRAMVRPDAVRIALSADASRIPGGGWFNLQIAIKPSDTGLDLASVRLGPYGLPADLVLPVLGLVLDVVLSDDLGQVAIRSIDGVAIDGETVDLGIALTRADRKALAKRAKDKVQSTAGISSPDDIRIYYLALDAAVRDGRLRSGGSVVPFLRFTMDLALRRTKQGIQSDEPQSALHAMAIYCGHIKYQNVVGNVVPEDMKGRPTGCARTTLGRRRDLRQHFVISAGLKAAGNAGVAFAIGEFKELLDSNRGGSGFSFDDLAADRAGIRFATTFLEAKPEQWQGLLDTLVTENAIFPSISGLPVGLSDMEFERRFGNVDSPAYNEILADIERRIEGLALFASR